ncbi:hypothetical protein LBR_08280 [Levilactobacillus brevis]|nr:hypothetical protein LBR_08280 [Levilactobacillus brevis]
MQSNVRKNRFLLVTALETILLGAYFIANSFRFGAPDLFNTVASHIDDPPFAAADIVVGTVVLVAALYDIRPLIKWCYVAATCVWTLYAMAFLLQNIEMMGHPFAHLDCWLMFAVAGRTILEAWAGDAN